MKARIVLRESIDTLKEGYGFINQREDCLRFASVNNLEVVQEHQVVESSSTWNRAKFKEIINEAVINRNEIPIIIFPRVDRFARNLEAAGYYLGELRQNGLKVMFAQEDLVVDNDTSVITVLMFFIHSYKADQDGKQIKHNMLGGRDRLATEALEIPNGMVTFPFDYQAKRLYGKLNSTGKPVINQELAAWVRKWVDWILEEGIGLHEVCRRMNAEGITTRRGGKFSPKAIRDILRSRQLVGEFRWKGELYLKDENLRILSDHLFEVLGKRLDENRERSYYNAAKLDYPPLRKKVFHSCGQRMYGVPSDSKPYYRCPKCRKPYINAQLLWEEVRQGIKNALMRDDWLPEQIRGQSDINSRIDRLHKDIVAADREIRSQEEIKDRAFRMGMILRNYPPEKVQEQINKADEQIHRLQKEKANLEKKLDKYNTQMLDDEGLRRFCRLANENIDKLDNNQWQMLNDLISLRITVYSKELILVDADLPVLAPVTAENEFIKL